MYISLILKIRHGVILLWPQILKTFKTYTIEPKTLTLLKFIANDILWFFQK